jgi:iron complex outermembrane receptor protein
MPFAYATSTAQTTEPASPPAEKTTHLATTEVNATLDTPAVIIAAAAVQLTEVPGTTSIVDLADVKRGRAANAEDMLSFQPGVYAQATSGNSANKISIRGSGLNTFYQGYSLGTKYLYDGQPITGAGGTQEELLAVASASYIEILNGPNAFSYASTSLGGAINFVTYTGYTAPGAQTRLEVGSFGYRRGEISYGGVSGKADYFFSVSHNERTGFQQNTPNKGDAVVLNFGYRFNDRLDTRLVLRFQREHLYNGSTLTPDQIDADPTQNNTLGLARPTNPNPLLRSAQSARNKPHTTVVSSKTTYTIDKTSKLEFGLSNTNYPLQNGWLFSNTPQDWRSDDFNITLRYLREDEIFGRSSKTTAIFSDTYLLFGDVNGYSDLRNGTPRTLTQYTKYTGSGDTVFALSNDFELVPDKLWFTSGLSYAELARDVRIHYTTLTTANPLGFPLAVKYTDNNFLPRAGLRFKIASDTQLFTSVSKAVDAPVTWQIGSTGSSYVRPLKPQVATTTEVGVRSKWSIFEGSLTFYRADIDRELLTIRISNDPSVLPVNANASPTVHQGIEAALTTSLWKTTAGDKLSFRQSFALNDFYYKNDPTYGHNELPSLPRETYQGELLYNHAKGFYAGVNVRYASSYFVDFANTVKGDPYTIFGAKIGYDTGRWQLFVDLRNLTDKHYASAANTAFNLAGNRANATDFYPGDGRNVIVGASLKF